MKNTEQIDDILRTQKLWAKLEKDRTARMLRLKNEINETYPLIKDIWINESAIELATENFSFRKSQYYSKDEFYTKEPQQICKSDTVNKINTAEDFIEFKEQLEEEKSQLHSTMWFLVFRNTIPLPR